MSKKTPATYGNDSISSLKGADRVRLRPGVIFGSDGLEGCEHSFFEILSNSIDEAREGYGNEILVTRYADGSLEVEDFGRGVPMGYNEKEGRFNWELVYCELYAGGKYNNDEGESYEYSLGSTGWAPVPRSMPRSGLRSRCCATKRAMSFALSGASRQVSCSRRRIAASAPAL